MQEVKTQGTSRAFLVALIVLIIVAGIFLFYYISASGRISKANSLSSTLADQNQSLQTQLSSANSQISTLQSQVSSGGSQVANLQIEISSLQSQLSSANAEISSLQSQNSNLQSIVNLSQSSIEASAVTINQAAGQKSTVITFVADYAGYIIVSGTSTTTNGYILVTDSFSGYPYNGTTYSFGSGATLKIPILPGSVSVYFGNTNLLNGATATITVTYYY